MADKELKLTHAEQAKLGNIQRQAAWFMGFFERQANRMVADAVARELDKPA